jgi:SAM-dependent methyltransferase
MDAQKMRQFWDARSREDAFFFVDDTLDYRAPDLERFWAGGEAAVRVVLETLDLELRPSDVVVDVGCGVGRITRVLAGRVAHVRALDVSGEMLARARELNPGLDNVDWVLGDGTSLRPVEDRSADAIVSWVVFQHIPDPEVTLGYVRDMARVLRPGGWSAFQVSDDPQIHARPPLARRIAERLRALAGRAPRGRLAGEWRGSAVGLDRLRATAAACGLTVERVVNPGTQFCVVLLRRPA